MAIPEEQLETWAKQGATAQSKTTYAAIKRALEADTAKYRKRKFEVFLQGSYRNDTNIFAESDVDVIIRYDDAFFHDLSEMTEPEQAAFATHFSDGNYIYNDFKADVVAALEEAFADDVTLGSKVINIAANGTRRSADVVVAFEYRRYFRFNSESDQNFEPGMGFFRQDGTMLANYPKQHSANCTAKHQATNLNFKPMIRIFKNLRSRLVDAGAISRKQAPSYFLEGLLYNVPDENFKGNYGEMFPECINWLNTADRGKFICVNEQYYLLRDNPVCWDEGDCGQFIDAAIACWNDWS